MEKKEIRFAGIGGQGILLMALLFARGVTYLGYNVIQTEKYGAEKRGSFSYADVIISDERIDYPFSNEFDWLVTMHQLGYDNNIDLIRDNAKVYADEDLVKDNGDLLAVPATRLAHTIGNNLTSNVVMLGAISFVEEQVSLESLRTAVKETLPEIYIPINLKALETGYKFMEGKDGA